MNRIQKTFIIGFLIISGFILFRIFFMGYYYDFLEYWTLRDKIVWTESNKLSWDDFSNHIVKEGLYTKVGLSSRYNVEDPILFRSKTVFIPKESYVSDTSDSFNLRVSQAKFDLLEIYRRQMVKEVDSLIAIGVDYYKPSDFKKMNERYYDLFESEWEGFKNAKNESDYLEKIEKKIQFELK